MIIQKINNRYQAKFHDYTTYGNSHFEAIKKMLLIIHLKNAHQN
jgi:hypothetical protein